MTEKLVFTASSEATAAIFGAFDANAKIIDLNDEKLYLILPEGMEIEE